MSEGQDQTERLAESVREARASGQSVRLLGNGSKSFLLPPDAGAGDRLLSVAEHAGVVSYRPEELVITVRAGTPLKQLRQLLARENQMLGCEPPEFRGLGTVGGALGAGLSGPGKPWRGSLRDAVLGIRLINGLGEVLRFGGEVMKNVAGYDVSRLQAGAFGTLGLILEVSLRVAPVPHAEQTLALELEAREALQLMRSLCRQPLPITGLAHHDGRLRVRLSGAEPAVLAAAERVGGEREDNEFWRRLNDQQLEFFREGEGTLQLERCAPATPLRRSWRGLLDWGGARRWAADETTHGLAFGGSYARGACLEPGGSPALGAYQARLRAAFDPESIFNRELTRADVAA